MTPDRELNPSDEYWGESTNYNDYKLINPIFKNPTQDRMVEHWDNFNVELHDKIKEIYRKSKTKKICLK